MAKLTKQEEFSALFQRYQRACSAYNQDVENYYYEKGFVKSPGKKNIRLATFEKMVEELEEKIRPLKTSLPESELENAPDKSTTRKISTDDLVPGPTSTDIRPWWKFW